jgi:hypothetical protein
MNLAECEVFEVGSRRWKICRNEAGLTPHKTNAYRVQWGLSPLLEIISEQKPVDSTEFIFHGHSISDPNSFVASNIYGPGTELQRIYQAAGIESYDLAKDLFQQMNNWGVSGCREQLETITADLTPHVSAWVAANRITETFVARIAEDIVIAIDECEKTIADRREKRLNVFTGEKITGCSACGGGVSSDVVAKRIEKRRSWVGKQVDRLTSLKNAAIDFWQDGMTVASEEQQAKRLEICKACPIYNNGTCDQDRGGCGCNLALKVKARSAYCPAYKWHAHGDNYRPLVSPTRNLIFHIYPKIGAEWNWHEHIERIRRHQHLFNGKIAIAVVTGKGLAAPENVTRLMDGIRVTDWVIAENTRLGETVTMTDLLRIVKTDDPNTITFRGHCKGVTHRKDGIEQPWAEMMWRACMDIQSVEDALASHTMAGALKCHRPLVANRKGEWFYAGTFYWFRNREIFQRDWERTEPTRWYIEAWPEIVCDKDDAACLFFDHMDRDILSDWKTIESEFDFWKAAR